MSEMTWADYVSLKASIARNKNMAPIIITRDGYVVDGHHRVKIALELGWESVPCVRLDATIEQVKLIDLIPTY